MRVFSYKRNIYNVDNNCPSIVKYAASGAEEIDIALFQGFERFADTENTKKVNDEWVFTFDPTLAIQSEIACGNEEKRKSDIMAAQEASGLKEVTIEQAESWIDRQQMTVEGNRAILKKMLSFLLG